MLGSNSTIGSPDSCWGRQQTSDAPDVVADLQDAVDACGGSPTADDNPWRSLLYDRLRDRALPALIAEETITPAASLWTGSRLWLDAFRAAGLETGDRLVIALPPATGFVQVLVAALWEGLSLALVPATADVPHLLDTLDARAAVTPDGGPHAWTPEGLSGPRSTPETLRDADHPPTPDARFLLRTSGTTGSPTWVALSDRNVLSVLASHVPHMSMCDARSLSVLPWSHAFGLVLDLFPALLCGAEIIRDPNGGRDADALVRLSQAWGATHLSAVPLTIDRLCKSEAGHRLLCSLEGGIVGGAPVRGSLAQVLAGTSLRAGYGQTEASPGIALGAPGHWSANYLGQPVGCDVDVADDGELLFRGPNACLGFWTEHGLDRQDPDRTVATGDVVTQDGDDLFFRGRKDDTFKLSNGRFVQAGILETKLRSRLSSVKDALVYTPDGTNLGVALLIESDATETPPRSTVEATLGSVGSRLGTVQVVDAADWIASPKGAVNRQAMTDHLRQHTGTSTTS